MPDIIYTYFLQFLMFIEHLCSKYHHLGKLYYKFFYRGMIIKEMELVDLKPGEQVLHIGGGSFPLTAIHLALEGYKVQAIDRDGRAVRNARRVVEKWGLQDKIEVLNVDGLEVSGKAFDVIWISLHVYPKDEIIRRLINTLPPSGRILYRNPRGILRYLYPIADPQLIIPNGIYHLTDQIIQKESVIIFR